MIAADLEVSTTRALEYLAALGAPITYRQLDYWIRTGTVSIAQDANGSGTNRRMSPPEVYAVADVAHRLAAAEDLLESCSSGAFYAERLAHHLINPDSKDLPDATPTRDSNRPPRTVLYRSRGRVSSAAGAGGAGARLLRRHR